MVLGQTLIRRRRGLFGGDIEEPKPKLAALRKEVKKRKRRTIKFF
jgi:hypothetical protein